MTLKDLIKTVKAEHLNAIAIGMPTADYLAIKSPRKYRGYYVFISPPNCYLVVNLTAGNLKTTTIKKDTNEPQV